MVWILKPNPFVLRKAKIVYNFGLLSAIALKNPIALRKAKTVYNFGLSECNWVERPKIAYNFGLSECNSIKEPIALRKAKIVYSFGLSECNRVKDLKNQAHVRFANYGDSTYKWRNIVRPLHANVCCGWLLGQTITDRTA